MTDQPLSHVPERVLLIGFGATNRSVARALVSRGHSVVATDDRPDDLVRSAAGELGVELVDAPDTTRLAELVADADVVVPGPGIPDRHAIFPLAEDREVEVVTEFDLAAVWDRRPIVAITGTNGKTTVTAMVAEMLREAGMQCLEAGNNDLPLVEAIEDQAPEWFVVEASSFRLGRTHGWAPRVATWLNLAPDHLDVHASHADYEAAKARLFQSQTADDVAVGNIDDPVVAAHLRTAPARQVSFSLDDASADYHVADGVLVGPSGPLLAVDDLPRSLVHDRINGLAAAATAEATGCSREAVVAVLRRFAPLPHRVCPVGVVDGITYYDDSKATVPHATLAALKSFDSVVLIAGGRNKGLDLSELRDGADHIKAVVAIGEAAGEIVTVFDGIRPVEIAGSMTDAVAAARAAADEGDVVLLSPACASYDWYPNYGARGDDFAATVAALEENR